MYGLDRYIYINENSLSKELCDEIIHKFEEEENKGPGSTFGGIQPKIKDTTDYNIEINIPKWSRIREALIAELINNIQIYTSKLDTPMYHSQPTDINQINHIPKKYNFKEINENGLFFEDFKIRCEFSRPGDAKPIDRAAVHQFLASDEFPSFVIRSKDFPSVVFTSSKCHDFE